jgi:phosphoglycerate dehydrogenase-like enzyme
MVRLLIHQAALARVATALATYRDRLTVLALDDAGHITVDGARVAADSALPDAAWASADVFESPAVRDFMIALLKSASLKWVQSAAAGFDHPVFRQLIEKGVTLTPSHSYGVGISEYVLAGVLDHFQRGPEKRAAQTERVWRRLPVREVAGSRWLIVGFGDIGQAVARRAAAFGAAITDLTPHPLADELGTLADLPRLAPAADVVVLSTPLTPATRHVADARFFAAMKAGAVLVNIGRGGLVDEAALLAALDRGAPGHAVLDVFETEPLPADSPFWTHPNVSLTCHSAGLTSGQRSRTDAVFLANLERYLAGEAFVDAASAADMPKP